MQICDPGAKTPDSVYIDKAYKMMQQGSFRYAKLKKFVKDQKKRTKKVSKKHEWTQRKSRLQQDA